MTELQHKKPAYGDYRQGYDTRENFKSIAQACRDGMRKAKAQMELRLVEYVKDKKNFHHCGDSKKQNKMEDHFAEYGR